MRASSVNLMVVRSVVVAAVVSTALLFVAGCAGSTASTSSQSPSPSPSPSPSTIAVAKTPEQAVVAYLTARAHAVLPGEPLAGLGRRLLAGVPWRQREELLATGKLLSEKALGHTLTNVDCRVTLGQIAPAKPASANSASIEADVTTTAHWTDATGKAGSDSARIAHTVTVVVADTETGEWQVVDDAYVDPSAPQLLTLARAGIGLIQAARAGIRAQTGDGPAIVQAAKQYWTRQRAGAPFMSQIDPSGGYLGLLAPGSPDRAVQKYAVQGSRRLKSTYSGAQSGVNINSLAINGSTVNAARTQATISATCWFSSGDDEGQSWVEVTDVSHRSLVLRKVGGRWLVWRDDYPPIGDLIWSPVPIAELRKQLQRAYDLGIRDGLGQVHAAPPAAIAAMKRYLSTVGPQEVSGATRTDFVWAFAIPSVIEGVRSTSTRLFLDVYFYARGPVVWAGDLHPGYDEEFYLLTRPSAASAWRVNGIYSP